MELSDEEVKTIETLKEVASDDFDTLGDDISPKMAQNILNVIDKQQKEIAERDKYNITTLPFEELKEIIEQNKNISIFGKEYISKDKIKEKIEEQRQKYFDVHDGKRSINEICFESTKVEGAVEVLKELLQEN